MTVMTEDAARWLLTEEGRAQAAAAVRLHSDRAEALAALTRLRKAATPERAAAAWELAELRARGRAKFGADAARMFFVRESLEQASSRRAAAYHARRLAQAGAVTVADVCGGIGGDALAFARAGLRVTLYERDPVRALFASENARVSGFEGAVTVVCADVTGVGDLEADAVWFDPARRSARGRTSAPEEYAPPLSLLRRWQARGVAVIGVKLAPAVDHGVAAEYGAEYGAALEFVSDGGECKEGLLWLSGPPPEGGPHPARRGSPPSPKHGRGSGEDSGNPLPSEERAALGEGRVGAYFGPAEGLRAGTCAVLLAEGGERRLATDPGAAVAVAGARGGSVLYEPDPAVIRAQGVATLAGLLKAQVLHPQVAYLLAESYTPTPFATAYAVVERLPYSRRRLQEALTRRGVGRVVIKKRGFPQEPDAVARELKLRGAETMTVVLTRAADGAGHQVILCRPVAAG